MHLPLKFERKLIENTVDELEQKIYTSITILNNWHKNNRRLNRRNNAWEMVDIYKELNKH